MFDPQSSILEVEFLTISYLTKIKNNKKLMINKTTNHKDLLFSNWQVPSEPPSHQPSETVPGCADCGPRPSLRFGKEKKNESMQNKLHHIHQIKICKWVFMRQIIWYLCAYFKINMTYDICICSIFVQVFAKWSVIHNFIFHFDR
jgi:hypothetical protein